MQRTLWCLSIGLAASILLVQLSVCGLLITDRSLYLFSLACSLAAVICIVFHVSRMLHQPKSAQQEVHVIVLQHLPSSDPLFDRIRDRL